LLVFIPYVGYALSVVVAGVSAILELGLGTGLLVIVVVYGLGQLLESFVLTPKIVGDRIGLHPLAVLLALVVFGSLLGFIGVLLALPLAAVLVVLGRRLLRAWHEDDGEERKRSE
jgi:predicted PurR-regulated permease PerM